MPSISSRTQPAIHSLLEKIESITGVKAVSIHSIDENATQNKNFLVTTESQPLFLKVYSQGSIDERVFEARVLQKLHQDGCSFPVDPITSTPFIYEGKPVMIFKIVEGTTLERQAHVSDEQLAVIATQLAQMHNSLRDFDPGVKVRFNALDLGFAKEFQLDTSTPLIKSGMQMLEKSFSETDSHELVTTIIHDDLSPSNLIMSETGSIRFIDFDDAHRSYRISDIGTAVKEFVIASDGQIDKRRIDHFISHYESTPGTQPLSLHESKLIIPMALRRALFMYAYYSMVEKTKRLYLQSNDELSIVAALTLVNKR